MSHFQTDHLTSVPKFKPLFEEAVNSNLNYIHEIAELLHVSPNFSYHNFMLLYKEIKKKSFNDSRHDLDIKELCNSYPHGSSSKERENYALKQLNLVHKIHDPSLKKETFLRVCQKLSHLEKSHASMSSQCKILSGWKAFNETLDDIVAYIPNIINPPDKNHIAEVHYHCLTIDANSLILNHHISDSNAKKFLQDFVKMIAKDFPDMFCFHRLEKDERFTKIYCPQLSHAQIMEQSIELIFNHEKILTFNPYSFKANLARDTMKKLFFHDQLSKNLERSEFTPKHKI